MGDEFEQRLKIEQCTCRTKVRLEPFGGSVEIPDDGFAVLELRVCPAAQRPEFEDRALKELGASFLWRADDHSDLTIVSFGLFSEGGIV